MMAKHPGSRHGATLVLVVIMLPVLFILGGLAINISYLQLIHTEAQIATDAAASAAGKVYAMTGDKNAAMAAAADVAARNPIGTKILPLQPADFEFGISTRTNLSDKYSFIPAEGGNAVRLTTHSLAAGVGGDIAPIFPVFGSVIQLRPIRGAVCTQLDLDIGLVIDRSGSMAYSSSEVSAYPPNPVNAPVGWTFGDPVPPNARWLDAIASVQVFISQLVESPQNEQLSLSLYNHNVSTVQPLTSDYSLVVDSLTAISAKFTSGGTNIGDGILEGIGAVGDESRARPWATPVLIVLTDGVHNYGTNPIHAAYHAKNQNVAVFTVTFSDEAEQGLMQDVANNAGGLHYHAINALQLKTAFKEIAGRLPTLITQ